MLVKKKTIKKKNIKKTIKKKNIKKTKKVDKKVEKKQPLIVPNKPFDYEDILLKNREVFIYEAVTDKTMERVIKQLMALDIAQDAPIKIWINCPGGSVQAGFALVNVMRLLRSHVVTIVNNYGASMGSIIAVAGDSRYIVKTGTLMCHDMASGMSDYHGKLKARAGYLDVLWKHLVEHYEQYTSFTKSDYTKLKHEELWLTAGQCIEKGACDKILNIEE